MPAHSVDQCCPLTERVGHFYVFDHCKTSLAYLNSRRIWPLNNWDLSIFIS